MLFHLRNTEAEGGKRSRSVIISCYTAELIGNSIVNAKFVILSGINEYSSLLGYDAV